MKIMLSHLFAKFGFEIHSFHFGHKVGIEPEYIKLLNFTDSKYSESLIRVGGHQDGSYLLPREFLNSISALFSPGIGESIEFDLEIATSGVRVYLADGSVQSLPVVIPNNLLRLVNVVYKHVGLLVNKDTINFNTWILENSSINEKIGIQIDIEGFEHLIVPNMSREIIDRTYFLIIEFHGFHRLFREDYIGAAHKHTLDFLNSNFHLIYSRSNKIGGSIIIDGREIPQAIEMLWGRK